MSDAWPFEEARDFGVFCSRSIIEASNVILLVAHDGDGSWQFLDGERIESSAQVAHVHLEHIFRLDPTVRHVARLPRGSVAERKGIGHPWSESAATHDS